MVDNQANLIASFPGLVVAMMDNGPADDWHVMVVDVDGQLLAEARGGQSAVHDS